MESTLSSEAIFAPVSDNAQQAEKLTAAIMKLRQQGKRVICELPDSNSNADSLNCTHTLSYESDEWQLVKI